MPSKTGTQARLMAAVEHGFKPDRIKGPPKEVAKEFNQADEKTGILRKAASRLRGELRGHSGKRFFSK